MLKNISSVLDILLRLDPQAKLALEPLSNKAFTVYLTDLDLVYTLDIKNSSISVSNDKTDNIISGKLAYIVELIFNKNLQELIIAKKLDYQGSLSQLNLLNEFIDKFSPDLFYRISKITNPSITHLIETPINKIKNTIKVSKKETIVDIREYLTEENKILISKNEAEIFYSEIQKIKQTADRINAKIDLLQGIEND